MDLGGACVEEAVVGVVLVVDASGPDGAADGGCQWVVARPDGLR